MAFSTLAHVPSSYPDTIPSSPAAIMTNGECDSDYIVTASSDWDPCDDEDSEHGMDAKIEDSGLAVEPELELEDDELSNDLDKEDLPICPTHPVSASPATSTPSTALSSSIPYATPITQSVSASLMTLITPKTCGSTKIKAHFVTHPELKDAFEEEEKEHLEKERVKAEKEAQKVVDANVRNTQIACKSVLKTFELPITLYKKKEDFEILATVLEISVKGTVQELTQRIKDYLAQHKEELEKIPCFAGLFSTGCRRKENLTSNGPDGPTHDELIA
ncbi:hypothetical protein C0991_003264 [Blastosporella zonata]|nr:hypothetical protein C0991_003264 [Blastosporella zonata]